MDEILRKYKELLIQKRYSYNTQKIYCNYFKDFVLYFEDKNLEKVSMEQINSYLLGLIKTKNISISQQNQRINAIKFYYEKVLGKTKQYYEIHRPNRDKKLPKVLSKNEVIVFLFFFAITTVKVYPQIDPHKQMLKQQEEQRKQMLKQQEEQRRRQEEEQRRRQIVELNRLLEQNRKQREEIIKLQQEQLKSLEQQNNWQIEQGKQLQILWQKELQRHAEHTQHLSDFVKFQQEQILEQKQQISFIKHQVDLEPEISILRYYKNGNITTGYLFINDNPIGRVLETHSQENVPNIDVYTEGSNLGTLTSNTTYNEGEKVTEFVIKVQGENSEYSINLYETQDEEEISTIRESLFGNAPIYDSDQKVRINFIDGTKQVVNKPRKDLTRFNKTGKHFLVFVARGGSSTGHAFVIWGKEDDEKKMSTMHSYGFYPQEESKKAVWGYVPADIVDEELKLGQSQNKEMFIVNVTPELYESSIKIMEDWQFKNFNLLSQNCVSFVNNVANEVGLNTPMTTLSFPVGYLRKLKAMNQICELHQGVVELQQSQQKILEELNRMTNETQKNQVLENMHNLHFLMLQQLKLNERHEKQMHQQQNEHQRMIEPHIQKNDITPIIYQQQLLQNYHRQEFANTQSVHSSMPTNQRGEPRTFNFSESSTENLSAKQHVINYKLECGEIRIRWNKDNSISTRPGFTTNGSVIMVQ